MATRWTSARYLQATWIVIYIGAPQPKLPIFSGGSIGPYQMAGPPPPPPPTPPHRGPAAGWAAGWAARRAARRGRSAILAVHAMGFVTANLMLEKNEMAAPMAREGLGLMDNNNSLRCVNCYRIGHGTAVYVRRQAALFMAAPFATFVSA
ncbi:hypothetical protein PWT90_09381 [Aphanocladium album]|nr:hypothetical protein PWT90_09381 [Aphanocladium album]